MSSGFFSLVKKALIILVGVYAIPVMGQDGPGGVGGGASFPLSWYKADDLNLSDNAPVTSWTSPNGAHMKTPSGQSLTTPTFSLDGFASGSGIKSVYFENTNYLEEDSLHDFQTSHHIFIVYRPTGTNKTIVGISSPKPNDLTLNGFNNPPSERRFISYKQNGPSNILFATNSQGVCASDKSEELTLSGDHSFAPNILYLARLPKVGSYVPTQEVPVQAAYNGNSVTSSTVNYLQHLSCYTDFTTEKLTLSRGDYLGYIAEVVAYSNVNSAQRKIIENYLSSKYSIPVVNDYYGLETGFKEDVAGIGKDTDSSSHSYSKSDIMSLSGEYLQPGSFAMVGHNGAATTLSSFNSPPSVIRMPRTWRIDLTGTTGILDFSLWDKNVISLQPGQRPVLLIDNDGNFNESCRSLVMEEVGNSYVVSGVVLNDGDYISFGVLSPNACAAGFINSDFFGKAENYTDTDLDASGIQVSYSDTLLQDTYFSLSWDTASLSYIQIPSSNFARTKRMWCVTKTGGPMGGVTITIDPNDFPALPAGFRGFNLLIDQDGIGFEVDKVVDLVREGDVYKAYGVNLDYGSKIAVGIDPLRIDKIGEETGNPNFNHVSGDMDFSGLPSAVNTSRINRVWQNKVLNLHYPLNFRLPAESFTLQPYQRLALLLDSDGNFAEGASVHVMDLEGSDYVASGVMLQANQFFTFAILNQYDAVDYNQNVETLGKADVNYEIKELTSANLKFGDLSNLNIQNYFIVGNNGQSSIINNGDAPLGGDRTSRVWNLKIYGNSETATISFQKSAFSKDEDKAFGILIKKVGSPDFSDASVYGMILEGDFYKAYNVPVKDGDKIAVGQIEHQVTHTQKLKGILKEINNELSNASLAKCTLYVKQIENFEFATPCLEKVKRAELQVIFNAGETYIFGNNFTNPAKVPVTIEGYADNTFASPLVSYTTELEINHQQPEKLFYRNVTRDLRDKGVKIYKVKVNTAGFVSSQLALIDDSLKLEARLILENETEVPVTPGAVVKNLQITGDAVKTFTWENEKCAAPYYQFQLLKLFNESAVSENEYVINATVDWSKALTLETSNHFITLTLVEGTGYYAWRVRPIGNKYEGGVANSRNWGTWSTANITIPETISLSCSSANIGSCLQDYKNTIFFYEQFDRDLNFIYTRTFTEDSRVHESLSFANGLLQVKQNQVKVPSNFSYSSSGKILVNQTVYDYSGRPAVNTLPAPVPDTNELGYRRSFLMNSGNLFGAANFDADDKIYNPDPVTGGPLSMYYSDTNPDKTIPSADGYPYTRTVFATNGSGKVMEEGGVGATHKIGEKHTVKMSEGTASEQELIRLFGDEAPYAGTVVKSTVTDPNGVVTITFTDKSGKVIATGVSKGGKTNLEELAIDEIDVNEVFDNNKKYGNNGLISSKEFSFTEETDVNLTYNISPKGFSASCGESFCTSCAYKLTIKVTDLNDPSSANNKIFTISIPSEEECSPDLINLTPFSSLTLPAGRYQIDKIIELDLDAANQYAAKVTSMAEENIQSYIDDIEELLEAKDIDSLNGYLKNLMTGTHPGLTSVQAYDEEGNEITSGTSFQTGYEVVLNSSCCSIRIPIVIIPIEPCEDPAINAPDKLGPYMLDELNKLKDLNGIPYSISRITNAEYSESTFNQLIENMMSETVLDTAGNPVPMYYCEDLLNCWLGILYTLETDKSEGLSSVDLTITEPENNTGAGIPDWAQDNTSVSGAAMPSVMDQFLDCAGRHYIGFVDNDLTHRVNAYKYFKYTLHDKPACESVFCNLRNADINNLETLEPGDDGYVSPCDEQMCQFGAVNKGSYYQIKVENAATGLFETWEGEHYNYYAFAMCIKSSMEGSVSLSQEDVEKVLNENKKKLEAQCQTACDSKYDQFMAELVSVYPYDGVGYKMPDNTYLSYEDLCCTARNLVEYCKDQCRLTIVKADCAPIGYDEGEDKIIKVGTPEEITRMQAIMFGSFELEPTDANSNCSEGFSRNDLCQVAAYSFTGNAEDVSGNGHNATLYNVTAGTDKYNNPSSAYVLNGSGNSYINAGANFSFDKEFTVTAWIKTTSTSEQYIISRENAIENKGIRLKIVPGGEAVFEGTDGSGVPRSSGTSVGANLMDGNWHFLAGVYNKGVYQIWIDGELKKEARFPGSDGNFNCTSSLVIGRNANISGTPYNFNGSIDQVQIFKCAFDQTRIAELYSKYYFEDKRRTSEKCNVPLHLSVYPEYYKQDITWTRSGTWDIESAKKVSDGFLFIGGLTDYWVIKTDFNLNVKWQRLYGGDLGDLGTAAEEITLNGNTYYVIGGSARRNGPANIVDTISYSKILPTEGNGSGDRNNWLLFVDPANGWPVKIVPQDTSFIGELNFGGLGSDRPFDIIKRSNGNGFLVIGDSNSDNEGNKTSAKNGPSDGWMYFVDNNFVKHKDQSFGASGADGFVKGYAVNDGYILLGWSASENGAALPAENLYGGIDAYIVKIDLNGDKVWEKRLGGSGNEIVGDMVETPEGNYILVGYSSSAPGPAKLAPNIGGNDLWVIKMSPSGYVFWDKTYGTTGNEGAGKYSGRVDASIVKSNNTYVLTAGSYSSSFSKGLIYHIDGEGNVIDNLEVGNYGLKVTLKVDEYNFITAGTNNGANFHVLPFGLATNKPCSPKKVCVRWIPPVLEVEPPVEEPEQPVVPNERVIVSREIKNKIDLQLGKCQLNNLPAKIAEYNDQCLNSAIVDSLKISYKIKQGHYTLYYYDRGGNLVKTVPPAGVEILEPVGLPAVLSRNQESGHRLVTKYKYNSLGQLTEQETPDGGVTKFVYNDIGQLRFSQNARQQAENKYSYTKYDKLGRVIEVGEAVFSDSVTSLSQLNPSDMTWPSAGTSNTTHTVYTSEAAHINYLGQGQRYLRNRVSYTYTYNTNGERAVTYYSYDPHGNVEWIVQEIPGMGRNTIAYEYDLISNKVLKVKYNENLPDQFFHKYHYDADNRITEVYTSKDGRIWDKDASYKYYLHGPLKRTEIGEDNIQGLDYVYTLQGWLKGINTPNLEVSQDPGGDGLAGSKFQKDEYGMVLGYYRGDFNRTGSIFSSVTDNSFNLSNDTTIDLFNGNISSWVSRIEQEARNSSAVASERFNTGQKFRYDYLNRIISSDFYSYKNTQGFVAESPVDVANAYNTRYTYDGNGNIKTLVRNGNKAASLLMDSLTYHYNLDAEGKLVNNKLRRVSEGIGTSNEAYTEDVDNQTEADNYEYDAIGNLIKDKSEKITITWNVYGKVATISPSDPSSTKPYITFSYDAIGNRVKKEVNTTPYNGSAPLRDPANIVTTYYVRDASGNVMAVYEQTNAVYQGDYYRATFTLKEQSIYGSSRLGLFTPGTEVASVVFHKDDLDKVTLSNDVIERVTEHKTLIVASRQQVTQTDINDEPLNGVITNLYKVQDETITPFVSLGPISLNYTPGSIATSESRSGDLQIVVVNRATYYYNNSYNNGSGLTCLVYDVSGLLMPNSDGIIGGNKLNVIVRKPGSETQYYLITSDYNKLYYHLIDLSLPGNGTTANPLGDVVSKNNLLSQSSEYVFYFTGALQAIEDYSTGKTYIYATEFGTDYSQETPEYAIKLVRFELSEKGGMNPAPQVLAKRFAKTSTGKFSEMQISPDGRKLAVYNHNHNVGWFDHQESEIIVFNLGYDYGIAENDLVNTLILPVGETYPGCSVEFSENNKLLYFSRELLVDYPVGNTNNASVVSRYEFRNGNFTDIQNGVWGDLRRKGAQMLVANRYTDGISVFTENTTGQTVAMTPLSLGIANTTLTGTFPIQNHKIYNKADRTSIVGRYVDRKIYEMSDHLGNVTVTFSDRLEAVINGSTLTNSVGIRSYNNYYAFGMLMPERSQTPGVYRYGFEGIEKTDEISGEGNHYQFKYREYDPRIGRFWSVDPLAAYYPWNSPYAFAENRVIDGIDLEGLEYVSVNDAGIDPDQHRNDDGTYSFSLGDQQFNNVSMVEWEGNQYFNLGQHMYYSDDGWSGTGTADNQMSQWVYTDIQNFDANTMHTYTWGDRTLTGNDAFGNPANTNCASLACAQAGAVGTNLQGGVVNPRGAINHNGTTLIQVNNAEAIDYINSQLEAGNAVVVGVNYARGGTDAVGTDHYVTITGRTTVNGEGRFVFMENATGNAANARDFNSNQLAPSNTGITGSSPHWHNTQYNVTRVQRNQ